MPIRKKIEPHQVGLHHSTHLEQTGKNRFVIVMDRKRRIVMKDGELIRQKIEKIRQFSPGAIVDIETTAPVCSKTKAFLASHNVSFL